MSRRLSTCIAVFGLASVLLSGCDGGTTTPTATPSRPVTSTSSPATIDLRPALPWDPPDLPARFNGVTSCGYAYVVLAGDATKFLGTCDGGLPKRLVDPLVVEPGTVFYVRVTHEVTGDLDFPIPTPSTRSVVFRTSHGPIAQYLAAASGSAYLIANGTTFCEGINPQEGSCRVLKIIVREPDHG